MSVRLVEAARAFATIADHLPSDKREALAEKIAELIDSSIAPTVKASPEPRTPAEPLPDPDHAQYDETAKFLVDHGYSSADLVRAAGRLEEYIKHHPNLTRVAARLKWLAEEVGMSR